MKTNFKSQMTAFVTMSAMVLSPTLSAFAEETLNYNAICGANSSNSIEKAKSDQTSSYCTQASDARTTAQFQTAKTVLMTLTAGYLLGVAWTPARASCKWVSLGADASGLALDITQSIEIGNTDKAMMTGMSSLGAGYLEFAKMGAMSSAVGNKLFVSSATKAAAAKAGSEAGLQADYEGANTAAQNSAEKAASDKVMDPAKKQAAQKAECLISAGLALAQAGMSAYTVHSAKDAENVALKNVKSLEDARGSSGFAIGGTTTGTTTGNTGTSTTPSDAIAESCGVKCLNNDPVSAAITANPDTVNALQNAMGGKSLDSVLKGYNGDGSSGSVAGYAAGALGGGAIGTAALKDVLDKADKLAENKDYKPATYIPASTAVASSAGGDLDFNKMMAGMMKQLNPDAKNGEDPSLIVFRQLDLLPPEKIESNKNISLFARMSYQYRKQTSNVDHLNWSDKNSARAPAAAPAPH